MLVIPVFIVHSFLITPFYPLVFGIPEATRDTLTDLTPFSPLQWKISQRWSTRLRVQQKEKCSRHLSRIKRNIAQLGFLKKV